MFSNLDLSALSVDDIVEEYKLLYDRHQQLKEQSEQDAQRIHELKRNLDTALAAEAYLNQELDQMGSQPVANTSDSEHQELEELRRKFKNLQAEQDSLQQDYDQKAEEAKNLRLKLESTEKALVEKSAARSNDVHEDCLARLSTLEAENSELMQRLADFEESSVKNTFSVAEKEKTIECLQDQVSCLEQNLHCKRDELEEKLQLLESCQEQLVDANAKIALLTSAPENNDRKGNSLFAEVDDQRQVMKSLLAAQKKSYLEMKKTFTESQFEIRRLKRENVAMHTELQACSTIFCSADKTYQSECHYWIFNKDFIINFLLFSTLDKLNERIRYLMDANDNLERQLNINQERLRELASEKSVTWLDSMLDFCKRETDDLKRQLHSMRIQKAGLEEQVRSVQQEMARWRFESLKSRCVIIDRENLLTEHKIAFKPMQAMEFNIKDAELKAALPRIVSVNTESLSVAASTKQTTNLPSESETEKPAEIINLITPLKPQVKEENLEPLQAAQPVMKGTPVKVKEETQERDFLAVRKQTPIRTHMGVKIKREVESNLDQELEKESQDEFKVPLTKSTPIKDIKSEQVDTSTLGHSLQNEVEEDESKSPPKPQPKGTPIKPRLGVINVKSDEDLLFKQHTPAKPQRKGTPVKLKLLKLESQETANESPDVTPGKAEAIQTLGSPTPQKPQRKGTPVRNPVIKDATNNNLRSILCKKRELFSEDSQKSVQFSSSGPIIRNLSPVDRLQSESVPNENEKPGTTEDGKDIKPTIKRPNIIRRIVVSSRKPTLKE
ncbi:hypothetical protein KR026_006276 [Drosophila bipectinata]|nr:hypothetical protein KR026_006276 [Drosophila bipectinata]